MNNNLNKHIVCFGEVLWDILPGASLPGGAPMNVAYHLHKQSINTAVITKVGRDDEGKKLLDIFSQKGIDTQYFQVDDKYQTGKVYARQDENKDMNYEIVYPVAWDFIEWEDRFDTMVQNAAFFVYGSLAARSKGSAATLFRLLEIASQKVLDINLRAPHYKKELLEQLLYKADLLKMNNEELDYVSAWFTQYDSIQDRVKFISERYKIREIVITKGKDGAILYTNGIFYDHSGYPVNVADTIGSGDAFLAGLLAALKNNVGSVEALEWASRLGAFIATKVGACPDYELADMDALFS